MTGRVGVAISTTGTRPDMVQEARQAWINSDPDGMIDPIVIITDVNRDGVAATKNRCLSALMGGPLTDDPVDQIMRGPGSGYRPIEHFFLADDDMWPRSPEAWRRYVEQDIPHLMLCWGRHRRERDQPFPGYSTWTWPRGVLLYAHRSVVERVGGMREEFGAGGHEHVEWSRRIHQAGFTPHPYMDLDHDPRQWFHAEDMPKPGETVRQFQARKRRHTTIKRTARDRAHVDRLWRELDGNTEFVDYR